MNIDEFKAIVRHIKLSVRCIKCKHFFKNPDIWIVSIIGDDCLMNLACEKCNTVTTLLANLRNNQHQFVTNQDLNDMKKFLKGFNGDFKSLFKKK